MARPIPRPAPVTRATLPAKSLMTVPPGRIDKGNCYTPIPSGAMPLGCSSGGPSRRVSQLEESPMLWRCFWAALALMLGADATLPGANADQTKLVFGKVLSLDLQDDGTGTLTALVRRPARVPLRPKEMTFRVTKETQFLTRSGRPGEGAVVPPRKVVDTFKKDTPVTVRYTEEAGRLARTVSTSAPLPTSDGDGKEGKSPDNKAAEGKHLKILGR